MTPSPERLQELVDDEDLDGLLAVASVEEIAAAWCRYHRGDRDAGDESDWWAVALFQTRQIFQRSELYRSLLLAVAATADDRSLGALGAGPLENFVSDDDDDLQWLEAHCAVSPNLRKALASVWCSNDVSANTLARLDRAAREPLARLAPRRH